jgi:hypothetical protein
MEEYRRVFKYSIGDRSFTFECDPQSKIMEAKSALCFFISNIVDIENRIVEDMAKKESVEAPIEVAKE